MVFITPICHTCWAIHRVDDEERAQGQRQSAHNGQYSQDRVDHLLHSVAIRIGELVPLHKRPHALQLAADPRRGLTGSLLERDLSRCFQAHVQSVESPPADAIRQPGYRLWRGKEGELTSQVGSENVGRVYDPLDRYVALARAGFDEDGRAEGDVELRRGEALYA
ncbi:MAG: hypothetical protein GXP39_07110 [Chloroflexi bacterium]|nr:hypothetical protein [Chloroflexota bacterium]